MKRFTALALALICLFGLAGCKPDGSTDLIELEEISAFMSEKGHTEEELRERLVGEFNENVVHSWGEPDYRLSGFWGYGWYFDDDSKRITLYFDADGFVEDVVIGDRSNETVNAILSHIAAEGMVSARFDSHIPNYIYEVEDLAGVEELLGILNGATYEVCDRPEEPWSSIEAVCITTGENEYYLGVIENSAFRVSVNGEGEYYACSCKDDFLNKLLELQGR